MFLLFFTFLSLVCSLPETFDWRNVNGVNHLTAVQTYLNPPGCESGWAWAASQMVGDRMMISNSTNKDRDSPSPQVILNCAKPETNKTWTGGCEGGHISTALEYMKKEGFVDETCMGYRAKVQQCYKRHICVNCFVICFVVDDPILYHIKDYGELSINNNSNSTVDTIKEEVSASGPVACLFDALPNLPTGSRPFYALITGWEKSSWTLKSLWGTSFGDKGFLSLPFSGSIKECWYAKPSSVTTRGLPGSTLIDQEDVHDQDHFNLSDLPQPVEGTALPYDIQAPQIGEEEKEEEEEEEKKIEDFPEHIDMRWQNGSFALTKIRSHHVGPIYCGACYSMASSSTVSDVFRLALGGPSAPPTVVSAQSIIDCVRTENSHGCFGGRADDVFEYAMKQGLPDETCDPFVSKSQLCEKFNSRCTTCSATPPFTCSGVDQKDFKMYFAKDHGVVNGETKMMQAMLDHGPIECMMATPSVFEGYTGGIMCDTTNATNISHDVELVGWGVENGTKYWIGRNSWGTRWGEGGWFRVCKGINNMQIESACAWLDPDLEKSGLSPRPLAELA